MLEQRSDSLQVNTAQSQARVMSLEQEKVLKKIFSCLLFYKRGGLSVDCRKFSLFVVVFAFIGYDGLHWPQTFYDIHQSQENLKLVVTCLYVFSGAYLRLHALSSSNDWFI